MKVILVRPIYARVVARWLLTYRTKAERTPHQAAIVQRIRQRIVPTGQHGTAFLFPLVILWSLPTPNSHLLLLLVRAASRHSRVRWQADTHGYPGGSDGITPTLLLLSRRYFSFSFSSSSLANKSLSVGEFISIGKSLPFRGAIQYTELQPSCLPGSKLCREPRAHPATSTIPH